jgi:predicted phosphoribosyltransferase
MILDKPMTMDESLATGARASKLWDQGRQEVAKALLRTIPILPEQAAAVKKYYGLEALRALDVNLTAAVEKYGPDFLTK